MDLVPNLAALTLRPLVEGTAQALRSQVAAADPFNAARVRVLRHLVDPRTDLANAVREACSRSWSVLELALAGPEWWGRAKHVLAGQPDAAALRQQLEFFFTYLDRGLLPVDQPDLSRACLRDLQQARQARVFSGQLKAEALSLLALELARISDPAKVDSLVLGRVADALTSSSYQNLASVVRRRPSKASLLAESARYYLHLAFRKNRLLIDLEWGRPAPASGNLESALAAAGHALATFGQRLHQLLQDEEPGLADPGSPRVLDLSAEQRYLQHHLVLPLYQKAETLGKGLGVLGRDVTLADGMALENAGESFRVRDLAALYRALPEHLRRDTPALCLAVGKLLFAAGEFTDARQFFHAAAALALDAPGQALAYWHASRAALERGDNERSLKYLEDAIRLDARAYAPFPVGKYHPVAVLGGGGLGISYRCWHRQWKADVVVKSLIADDLDRPAEVVLDELKSLINFDHPSLVTILDADWTRPDVNARPYLMRALFDGVTLEDYVSRTPLSHADWLEVAVKLAEGVQALHAKGVLHRDLKPGNVFVRKDDAGWQVKLVNAGLGWRREALRSKAFLPTLRGNSLASSIACTAPELIGDGPVESAPTTDVFSFGRTSSYALLRTTQPKPEQWGQVPKEIVHLLVSCMLPQPKTRLADFTQILDRLHNLNTTVPNRPKAPPDEPPVPPPPPEPSATWRWLPPPGNQEPDPHTESEAKLMPSPHGWPVVAARVRGKKHKHEGTHCDDWFAIDRAGHWSVIAVADGAGSRKFSRVGAKAVCVAAVERLKEFLGKRDLRKRDGGSVEKWYDPQSGVILAEDLQHVQEAVLSTMEATADVLKKTAEARASSPLHEKSLGRPFEIDDLSSTLLLAVHNVLKIDGHEYSFVATCHVGDGMIAAVLPDGKAQPLAKPDGGEHAGETDFVTSKGRLERSRLRKKTFVMFKPMRALLVMTDGASDDYFPPEPGMSRLYADLVLNRVIRYPDWMSGPVADRNQQPARECCQQTLPVPTATGIRQDPVRSAEAYLGKLELSPEDAVRNPELLRGGAVPLAEGEEPGPEESLRRWLDAYTVRGSFDDRTLVVLHRPTP